MAPAPIHVRRYDDYVDALQKAKVVLDADRRKAIILADAKDLAFAQGLTLVEDEGLLEEVAGLVEWPVVLMGEFEPAFLDLPPEVIRATIRANQKCFVLREQPPLPSWPGATWPSTRRRKARKRMAPWRGTAWMAGTRPAMTRQKPPAGSPTNSSSSRTSSRGTAARRSRPATGASCARASPTPATSGRPISQPCRTPRTRAQSRSTSDWRSSNASSFTRSSARRASGSRASRRWRGSLRPKSAPMPSLRRARRNSPRPISPPKWSASSPSFRASWAAITRPQQGEDPSVAAAIEEHYKPQGPNDRIPTAPVSIAVALADKLDTLVGFWAIDEKPTGSKDPYALRRAALGVIRIILEDAVRLNLFGTLASATFPFDVYRRFAPVEGYVEAMGSFASSPLAPRGALDRIFREMLERAGRKPNDKEVEERSTKIEDLLAFFADRLKIYLREKGARHDLIDAVFALPGQDDLLMIVRRVEALGKLLDSNDGKNLLVGYRRAANILRAEEKKDGADAFAGRHVTRASPRWRK